MKEIENYELKKELLLAVNELKKNSEHLHIYNFSTNPDILTVGSTNDMKRMLVKDSFNVTEVLEILVRNGYVCLYRITENDDVFSLYVFWKPNFLMQSLIERGYEKFVTEVVN